MKTIKKISAIVLTLLLVISTMPFSAVEVFAEGRTVECSVCGGTGTVDCSKCNGTGKVACEAVNCENGKIYVSDDDCNNGYRYNDETGEYDKPCETVGCEEGKIYTDCTNCVDGFVSCSTTEVCSKCAGAGTVTITPDSTFAFVDSSVVADGLTLAYSDSAQAGVAAVSTAYPDGTVEYSSSDITVATVSSDAKITTLKSGTTTIFATLVSDDMNYDETVISYNLTVKRATPSLTVVVPTGNKIKCEESFNLTVNTNSDADATYTISGDAAKLDGNTVTGEKAGSVTITASLAQTDKYDQATASVTLDVEKIDYTNPNFKFETESPSDLAYGETFVNKIVDDTDVKYSLNSGAGAKDVELDGYKVTAIDVTGETNTITATREADEKYNEATVSYSIKTKRAKQEGFAFETPSPANVTYGITDFQNKIVGNKLGVTYKSSDNSIAEVDGEGKLTIKKAGTVTITASTATDDAHYEGAEAEYTLTIEKADQTGFAFAEPAKTIKYGENFTFKATGGQSTGAVTYSTSNSDVATVDSNGKVTTKKAGVVEQITATKAGDDCYNEVKASYYLTVEKAELGYTVKPFNDDNEIVFTEDDTYELKLNNDLPSDCDGKLSFVIESGSERASIDNDNLRLTTLKAGNVTIKPVLSENDRYVLNETSYSFNINKADQVLKFANGGEKISTKYGCAVVNKATLESNGTDSDIVYSSNNNELISGIVDGKIEFNDVKVGSATITASKEGDERYKDADISYELEVSYLEAPTPAYTISTAKETTGWYVDPSGVVIVAPEGYLISDSNSLANNNGWKDKYILSDDNVYDSVKLALKRNEDDAITDYFDVEEIKYDKTAPAKPTVTYSDESEGNGLAKLMNKIEDIIIKLFYKDKIGVTFESSDNLSGVDHFTYKITGKTDDVEIKAKDGKATFYIDAQFKGRITDVIAYDVAGNSSNISDDDKTELTADTVLPVISVEYLEQNDNGEFVPSTIQNSINGIDYYSKNQKVQLTINEMNFDAADVKATIGITDSTGKEFVKDDVNVDAINTYLQSNDNWSLVDESETEHRAVISLPGDANYSIKIEYIDLSKNEAVPYEQDIIVDTTAPDLSVEYLEQNDNGEFVPSTIQNSINGIDYYSKNQKVQLTINEMNFDAADVKATIGITDSTGKEFVKDDVNVDAINTYLQSNDNWSLVDESETEHRAVISLPGDANYSIKIEYIDLSKNEAVPYEKDITVDTTAPDLSVKYSKSIVQRVLETITFGIYNAKTTVEITANDKISPIYNLTYEAKLQDDVSSVNQGIEKAELYYSTDAGENTFVATEGNPGKVKISFDIDPQFRGFVEASTENMSALKTSVLYDKARNPGVIVDSLAPEYTVELTQPKLILNRKYDRVDVSGFMDTLSKNTDDKSNVLYYDNSVDFKIYITEANFVVDKKDGKIITDAVIKVNGKEQEVDWLREAEDVYSAMITLSDEGNYVITAEYSDPAKNKMIPHLEVSTPINLEETDKASYTSQTIIIDKHAPEITSFSFATDGYYKDNYVENNNEKVSSKKDPNRYDYYFEKDAVVTISANDAFSAGSEAASGIKDIVLVTRNVNTNKIVKVSSDSFVRNGEKIDGAFVENATATWTFTIKGPFKGDIFAVAIDRLGHYPTVSNQDTCGLVNKSYANKFEYIDENGDVLINAGFVAPYDAVVEDGNKHLKESSITITPVDETANFEFEDDSNIDMSLVYDNINGAKWDSVDERDFRKDNKEYTKVPLYNTNVKVDIDVVDTYSGIRQIDWFVLGNQDTKNNQQGTLTINNDGKLSDNSWKKVDADSNLVTNVHKQIKVTNNSNDIVILTVLTDRAGNKSYDYNVIGIDKTKPQAVLTYDDNGKATYSYGQYYNHERTATITVTERNFDAKQVELTIDNVEVGYAYVPNFANIIKRSAWKVSEGENGNKVFTYTIKYAKDKNKADMNSGTFDFSFICTDFAGNEMNEPVKDRFVIDYIAPKIEVRFEDGSNEKDRVKNGFYFKDSREATIIITEHVFNYDGTTLKGDVTKDFTNGIKASLNGTPLDEKELPIVGKFTRKKGSDVWSTKIKFLADEKHDGDYTLAFSYKDAAGNEYSTKTADFGKNGNNHTNESFTIDSISPKISVNVKDKYAYDKGPIIEVTQTDNNCYTINSSIKGFVNTKDPNNTTIIEEYSNDANIAEDKDHSREINVKYDVIKHDGYYEISGECEDKAGNKNELEVTSFTKNDFGSVYVLSDDLRNINGKVVNYDSMIKDKNLQIIEYSPNKINVGEVYIQYNGEYNEADKDVIKIGENEQSENEGWYKTTYTIQKLENLNYEGEFSVYLRSYVTLSDKKTYENNSPDKKEPNRVEVNFVVDNTNPFVTISGMELRNNTNETKKTISLKVTDDNISTIKATVGSVTYCWPFDEEAKKNGYSEYNSVEDSDLTNVNVSFDVEIGDSGYAQDDITLSICDKAGNYCVSSDDYNRSELYTDVNENNIDNFIIEDENGTISFKEFYVTKKKFSLSQWVNNQDKKALAAIGGTVVVVSAAVIATPFIIRRKRLLDLADRKELD